MQMSQQKQEEEPQFGVVDIVEAFTAMRHEWHAQSRGSRQLLEQLTAATQKLDELARTHGDRASEPINAGGVDTKKLIALLADMDHQLTRALQSLKDGELQRMGREQKSDGGFVAEYARLSPLARWFAKPLLQWHQQQDQSEVITNDASIKGIELLLSRYRGSLKEIGLERIDVVGAPFDGTMMLAIGSVKSSTYEPGHVAEQLAPCYRWNGAVLRFAEVRVAQAS